MLIKAERFADDQAMMANCQKGLQRVRPTESGQGSMPRDLATFRGPGWARNELIKNIIISNSKFMIYAFLNVILLTLNYNQFKLQASEYYLTFHFLTIERKTPTSF